MATKPKVIAVDIEWKDRGTTNRRAFGITPTADGKIVGDYKHASEAKETLLREYDIIDDVEWIKSQAGLLFRLPHVVAEISRSFHQATQISVVEVYFFDGSGQQLVRYEVRRQNETGVLGIFNEEGHALGAAGEWIRKEVPEDASAVAESRKGAPKDHSHP